MKRQWTPDELMDQWTLTHAALAWVGNKAVENRLGFALLLTYFQHEGHFPQNKGDLPGAVIAFIARQVDVPADTFLRYAWSDRTIKYHRALIRAHLNFREATVADTAVLSAWLCTSQLSQDHRIDRLEEALAAECRRRYIEPPTTERIARLMRSAIHTFETRLYAATLAHLSPVNRRELDALLYDLPDLSEGADPPDRSAAAALTLPSTTEAPTPRRSNPAVHDPLDPEHARNVEEGSYPGSRLDSTRSADPLRERSSAVGAHPRCLGRPGGTGGTPAGTRQGAASVTERSPLLRPAQEQKEQEPKAKEEEQHEPIPGVYTAGRERQEPKPSH